MSDETMGDLVADYLKGVYEYRPETAFWLGLHEYGGKVHDPSERARRARVEELGNFRDRLSRIDDGDLTRTERLDYDLIDVGISYQLYELEDLREHEWNPVAYAHGVDVSNYTKRAYAPLPERIAQMARHLGTMPDYLQSVLSGLRDPLPRAPLEIAIDAFRGQLDYLRGEARASVEDLEDRGLMSRFEQASDAAADSLEQFIAQLETRLERADGNFAIGRERYEKMLRFGELVNLPVERVLEVGEADLQNNEEQVRITAARIAPNTDPREVMRQLGREHPSADRLVPETAAMLEEIRTFLIEQEIVSVPSEVRCEVTHTPPYMRWAFAAMDPPGPFETVATEAYYYVTPPEPSWTPEEQEEWLSRFDYHTLRDVSIHEAYPGHYVHFLHMQHAPTDASKALSSYAFIEGWAHYCEQMMVEAGYGNHDPRLRLAQLREALLRDCRYIVSIKMHTHGMTVEEATRFLLEHGYMDELPARREAQRGTFDPGYLNYTLGKLQILKLREDYEREKGMEFSLRAFHDELLAYGAPPVPLLRKLLLQDGVGEIL